MNKIKFIGLLLAFFIVIPAMASTTDDERIDSYLNVLATAGIDTQEEMLESLQWSGLTDERLFDEVEKYVVAQYLDRSLIYGSGKKQLNLVAYQIRALGYSGNEKYRSTITMVKKDAVSEKLRRHAKKALVDLDKYISWNKLIAESDLIVEGESVEVATYMKMLSVNNVFVQRLAARAIFHENQRDVELLDLASDKLKTLYLQEGLDGEAQDTAAWLCKAIGQSGEPKYIDLLTKVADETPYRKIKKYAKKFTQ